MKYTLALVDDETGAILGRSNLEIHAHSEVTRTLKKDEPGVGRKGDVVRVAHVLEDPVTHGADLEAFLHPISLALVADLPDAMGDQKTVVVKRLSHVAPVKAAEPAAEVV
jgi:hypothetical protein